VVIVNDNGGDSRGVATDSAPAEEVAAEIRALGGRAQPDFTDVSNWANAQLLVDDIIRDYGRLDIIINNAGVSRTGTVGDFSEEDWVTQFHVNVKAPTAIIDAAARHWRVQPKAHRAIVNTSSPAGASPLSPIGIYSATKAAVAAMTIAMSAELAPLGVHINAIAPVARTRLVGHAPQAVQDRMRPTVGFDPYLPVHTATLVEYLVSPECSFTGRLFGCVGDHIFLYRQWTAAHMIENGGNAWEPEQMAEAMNNLPLQDIIWEIGADGRRQVTSPLAATFRHLLSER